MSYKYLGDIVVVEHLESNVKSNVLLIPELHRESMEPVRARVIGMGKVAIAKRKAAIKRRAAIEQNKKVLKHFCQDDLYIGDEVYVPSHLGTRGRIKENPRAIIYDSVDILLKVV